MITPNPDRFTPHTYNGRWYVRDNRTGETVTASNGRRLFYPMGVDEWSTGKAMGQAKRKAARMNALYAE